MSLKKWNKLDSRKVTGNNYWSYYLDRFEMEDGTPGEYHYVHTLGSSMVIPVTSSGQIVMVNQFRYLNQKESLEFPCGAIQSGLSPEENALKELREETGFSSARLELLGEFSPYTGASDEMCTLYAAYELFHSPLPKDETEEFEIVQKSPDEISSLISDNSIWDGLTLSAWCLAQGKLKL